MTASKTPAERAREQLHRQVTAAAAAAAADWRHPGHWELHHTALPGDGPGDFTPYRAPDHAEHGLSPLAFLERLAEILGPDHAQVIAQRGLEAGQ
jgi:hypothetical protein